MEIRLRQRIIGAVVLAALIIIFLPLLFKNSTTITNESKPLVVAAQIPPAPEKPVPAPQTIVMIKNKDLTTPDATPVPAVNSTTVQGTATSSLTTAQPAIPPSTATTATNNKTTNTVAASATTQPTVAANTVIPQPIPAITADKNPSVNNAAQQNINNIEDAALNPAGMAQNSTNNTASNKVAVQQNPVVTTKAANLPANPAQVVNVPTKTEATPLSAAHHKSVNEIKSVHEATTKKHPTATTHHTKAKEVTNRASSSVGLHKKTSSEPSASASTLTINNSVTKSPVTMQSNKVAAGVAWEVRLGSFANNSNVKDLVNQLRARGFKVYTQPVQTTLGTLTRVVIGPEVKRDKADAIQTRLLTELNIKSEVVPFNPTADK